MSRRRHAARKMRLKKHSQRRASERYQLEQHVVDLLRKRVRRFFQEGQQCPGNDMVVIEQQSYNKFRLMLLVSGEWVHVVYHLRYHVFVTFLPPEEFAIPDSQAASDHDTEVPGPDRRGTSIGAQL